MDAIDDACEGVLLGQFGVVILAFLTCIVSFVLGAGALVLSNRRSS